MKHSECNRQSAGWLGGVADHDRELLGAAVGGTEAHDPRMLSGAQRHTGLAHRLQGGGDVARILHDRARRHTQQVMLRGQARRSLRARIGQRRDQRRRQQLGELGQQHRGARPSVADLGMQIGSGSGPARTGRIDRTDQGSVRAGRDRQRDDARAGAPTSLSTLARRAVSAKLRAPLESRARAARLCAVTVSAACASTAP